MPFNAIVIFILAGWFWKNKGIMQALSNNGSIKLPFTGLIWWLIRVVAPAIVLIIVIKSILDTLSA